MTKLFHWGGRREIAAAAPVVPALSPHVVWASVVLPKFVSAVSQCRAPVILDLGQVVGTNVAYFGDRLACKMLIGDLRRDLDAAASTTTEAGERMLKRLAAAITSPVNGILCWDAFDCLDRRTSQALGTFLTSILAPGGVVHGIFGTIPGDVTYRTRFVLQSGTAVECRRTPAPPVKRTVLQTRDLTLMFAGLTVAESVLLKSQYRETLLRKA